MSIKYFIRDKIIFFRYRFYLTKRDISEFFKKENLDNLNKQTSKIINVNNLIFILILLVLIKILNGVSKDAVIIFLVLVFIIRFFYMEWRNGAHRGWGRKRKMY